MNSASCMFFSPAAPSEPTPRPEVTLEIYSLLFFDWFSFNVFIYYLNFTGIDTIKKSLRARKVVLVKFVYFFGKS